MKIFHAGLQLTDWSDYPALNVSVNGQTAFEAVDIVRALAKRFYSRGNDAISFQFGVRREFDTHKDAQNYYLTVFSTLPKFGLCQIICGVPGNDDSVVVSMANAILTSSQGACNGVEVVMQFTIQAGAATTDTPIDLLIGGEAVILRGKEPVTTDAETVAILFDPAFAPGTDVIVTATYAKAGAGGANIVATVVNDLVTVDGFTAELSGPSPAGGFVNWIAVGT